MKRKAKFLTPQNSPWLKLRATSMNGVPGRRMGGGGGVGGFRKGGCDNQKHRESLSVFPLRLNPEVTQQLSLCDTLKTPGVQLGPGHHHPTLTINSLNHIQNINTFSHDITASICKPDQCL